MYSRGDVVKGPDLFGSYDHRPFVCLSDDSHPFSDEEAIYTAVTTTERSVAVPLSDEDFKTGGLERKSYVNPWTLTTIRHTDIAGMEGELIDETAEEIVESAARYLGISF